MPRKAPGVWNSVYTTSKWVDATAQFVIGRVAGGGHPFTYHLNAQWLSQLSTFDASDNDVSWRGALRQNTGCRLVDANGPVYQEASESACQAHDERPRIS